MPFCYLYTAYHRSRIVFGAHSTPPVSSSLPAAVPARNWAPFTRSSAPSGSRPARTTPPARLYILRRVWPVLAGRGANIVLVLNLANLLAPLYALLMPAVAVRLGRLLFLERFVAAPWHLVHVIFISFVSKDLQPFEVWFTRHIATLDFWSYRRFFGALQFVWAGMTYALRTAYPFAGSLMLWRGKINIAGNGRTRTLRASAGCVAVSAQHSTFVYRHVCIDTFTGNIGATFALRA